MKTINECLEGIDSLRGAFSFYGALLFAFNLVIVRKIGNCVKDDVFVRKMQVLEAQRSELQSTSNKYTAVQSWPDTFKETAAVRDIYS